MDAIDSRFVAPNTRRVNLSRGDWLLLKTRLNTGEERAMLMRASVVGETGERRLDPLLNALATAVAYLVDWSLTGTDGKPVIIRGRDADAVIAALDALDPDDFREVKTAIETHEVAMHEEREQEKKLRTGASGSSLISPSPVAAAGQFSG